MDVQTSLTLTHFNVVHDTTPFLTFSPNFRNFSLKQLFLCPWNTLSVLLQSSACFIFRQPIRMEQTRESESSDDQGSMTSLLVLPESSSIHGDYLNTLSLLKHGTRTIHWLLACRADDVVNYQSHDCSNSKLPNSKIILPKTAARRESKHWGRLEL